MAAGIQEHDFGYLNGKSWHMSPRFVHIEEPVSIDQMREVFNWEIEKSQHYIKTTDGVYIPTKSYSLLRTDTQHVLCDSVGERFVAESNLRMADIVANGVLNKFEGLDIEGAFTLWNNKVAVIQLKGSEFQVKGDKSPTHTRMLYTNPIGMGAYKVFVHNERVVCSNTLRIAEAEGAANKTMKKFSHTQSAFDKINVYMEELAETQLMLTKHIEMLNVLAAADTNEFQVAAFMKAVYPITKDMAELQVSRAEEKRARIRAVFESDQDLEASAARSKYALLNALTYVIDHEQQRKDDASAQWDNWTGGRMDTKAEGLNFLMGTLAA